MHFLEKMQSFQKSREYHYFNGSKLSHELAMRLRTNVRRACISAIQAAEGKICTIPEEINTVFLDFYKNLYISEILLSTDEFRHFC